MLFTKSKIRSRSENNGPVLLTTSTGLS